MNLKRLLFNFMILLGAAQIRTSKIILPNDIWIGKNYVFENNSLFPVDCEEIKADELRTFLGIAKSDDKILRPLEYLWVWLFNRQSLVKAPLTQSPMVSSTLNPSSTASIMHDEGQPFPLGRSRRPPKYKNEGYCQIPPLSHVRS